MKCDWPGCNSINVFNAAPDLEWISGYWTAKPDPSKTRKSLLCGTHLDVTREVTRQLQKKWGEDARAVVSRERATLPVTKSKLYTKLEGHFLVRSAGIGTGLLSPTSREPIKICSWFVGETFEEAIEHAEEIQVELGMPESVGR